MQVSGLSLYHSLHNVVKICIRTRISFVSLANYTAQMDMDYDDFVSRRVTC